MKTVQSIPACARPGMGRGLLTMVLAWMAPIAFSAAIPWHLATADLRFEMSISNRPREAVAGIIAVVPDGGILPRSKFKPTVVDSTGKPLKSETLWHNPNEGLALVFEPPATDSVFIYIQPSSAGLKFVSAFRPSLLLYVCNGNAGLKQAHALANHAPVGKDIYFAVVDRIFHSILPVGRDENTSSYYTGWLSSPKPGKTYFYTLSCDGSEFFIDGKLIHSWPGRHNRLGGQRGEHGKWVNITPGLHKVDYFHFSHGWIGRESQLGWHLPGTPMTDDPKAPGKKRPTVNPLEAEDFVHSGTAVLVKAESRKWPVALFSFTWESFIRSYEDPVCLFRFHVIGDDASQADTTCEWDFGNHQKVKGKEAVWLYAGKGNQKITLTVSRGHHASKCTRTFFPKSMDPDNDPPLLFVTNAETRLLYSQAFLNMCRAVPTGSQRPCKTWSASLWTGLLAVAESPLTIPLLTDIFERSRPDILKLPSALRGSLEDIFFDALRQTNQAAARTWLDRLEKEERDPGRAGYWKAARVEYYLYDVNDLKKARIAAMQFMNSAGASSQSALAMIRMGDVERLSGNMEQARRLYGKAQETRQSGSNNWKIMAVHEAAFYATVQSLIQQEALTEARQTLDQWERELPLSKLSGDYPLAEARYFMALKHYQRALKILSGYRKSVDLTNYLPEAMKLEFRCLALLGQHDAALDLARLIIKRLPNHPLAEEAKTQLLPENRNQLTLGKEAEMKAWTSSEKVKSGILADLFATNKTMIVETAPTEDAEQ